MKLNSSRRDFLKLAFMSIGAFLSSCMPRAAETYKPTFITSPTNTNTAEPTTTNTQTPLPTDTATPTKMSTPTEIPCFHLLTPENNSSLKAIGRVTFSWETMPGAASHKLEIILPTQHPGVFETLNTNRDQYIEVFSMGGVYQWQVTALDASGSVICTTKPFAFEKPEYIPPIPTSTPTSANDDDGGGIIPTLDWSDWSID